MNQANEWLFGCPRYAAEKLPRLLPDRRLRLSQHICDNNKVHSLVRVSAVRCLAQLKSRSLKTVRKLFELTEPGNPEEVRAAARKALVKLKVIPE